MYINTASIISIFLGISCLVFFCIKYFYVHKRLIALHNDYNRLRRNLIYLADDETNVIFTRIKTVDDFDLDSVLVRNPLSNKCIILFDDFTGNLSTRYQLIKYYYMYASVVAFDYRSYGRSSGCVIDAVESGLILDGKAVYNSVVKSGFLHNNIVFIGVSIGCTIAAGLLTSQSLEPSYCVYPKALIFHSIAEKFGDIICHHLEVKYYMAGKLFPKQLCNDFSLEKYVDRINCCTKIIIAHSIEDRVTSYNNIKNIYNRLKNRHCNVEFIDIDGFHTSLQTSTKFIYALARLFEID